MPRNEWRNRAEYALLQMVRTTVVAFPIEANLRTAGVLAWVWSRLVRHSHARAVANIQAAFGNRLDAVAVDRLARRSLQNFVMTGIELLQSPRLINRWSWPKYIRLRNVEEVLELAIAGRPAILVSGHFGNFELLGQLLACVLGRFAAVMRPMNNPRVNALLVDTRRHSGLELIMKKGAVATVRRLLREGRFVGFMPDQNAGTSGLFVNFFGRPASTVKTVGLLACEHDVPVVVGYCRRLPGGFCHEVGVERIIRPGEWAGVQDPVRWITQEYTTLIEGLVRRHPDQYLWAHRRWKSQPRHEPAPR